MKNSLLIFTFIIVFINLLNAQRRSENGYALSTQGTVRIFTIFVQVDYSLSNSVSALPSNFNPNNLANPYGAVDEWPDFDPQNVPTNPLLSYPPSYATEMFDADWNGSPTSGTITDYYYEASRGELIVLGDYIAVTVPCTYPGINTTLNLSFNRTEALLNYISSLNVPLITANNHTIDDFDSWEFDFSNNGVALDYGLVKNNNSDGNIDILFVIWKNQFGIGQCPNGGLGVNDHLFSINLGGESFNTSFISDWGACTKDGIYYMFTAEFLHGLFGGNNWHSVGGAGPYTFMTYPHFYCTTAQYDGISNSYCAYDRWFLGWKGDKQYTTGALDATGTNEVLFSDNNPQITDPYPYVYSQENNPEALTDGIYCLRITDAQHKLLDKITFIKSN